MEYEINGMKFNLYIAIKNCLLINWLCHEDDFLSQTIQDVTKLVCFSVNLAQFLALFSNSIKY